MGLYLRGGTLLFGGGGGKLRLGRAKFHLAGNPSVHPHLYQPLSSMSLELVINYIDRI